MFIIRIVDHDSSLSTTIRCKRGILISMSWRRNCYENAMIEIFFKTLKSERVWLVDWQSHQ